jgi:hypothetical protein
VSRSFGKVSGRKHSGYENKKDIRLFNRNCIHLEKMNPGYGDVVFSSDKKVSESWDSQKDYRIRRKIRTGYNLEIRNILNSHSCRSGFSWDKAFLEAFNYIKGSLPGDAQVFPFEWLNTNKAKEAVRRWKDNPFGVLKFLTDQGLIEKAILKNLKKKTAK